ncbi:MAG: glutamate-1-semialdehyde 2,1-aminomutase, partial [Xanthobacteraceae bacterium]
MDHFAIIGASYKTAAVERLAQIALPRDALTTSLPALAQAVGVREIAYIGTCNRIEVLLIGGDGTPVQAYRQRVAAALGGAQGGPADGMFRAWEGEGALEHLLLVTAGFDSAQAGEREISDQVRAAWAAARAAGTAGPQLGFLFTEALRIAQEVHRDMSGLGPAASLADSAAARVIDHLQAGPGPVALIGVSPMTKRCARMLSARGTSLIVVNRDVDRARKLAATVAGAARSLDAFLAAPDPVAAIVIAVGGSKALLTRSWLEGVAARADRPILVLDLGVPANVERSAEEVGGIELVQMDQFVRTAQSERVRRLLDLAPARLAIDRHLARLVDLFTLRGAGPLIGALSQHYAEVAADDARRLLARELKDLGEPERQAVLNWADTLGRRLAHLPIMGLRQLAADAGPPAVAAFVKGIESAAAEPARSRATFNGQSGRSPFMQKPTTTSLYERACRSLPGGVNSPVRAYRAVGGTPPFISRGEGSAIFDEEGRRYVDFVCSWGALILGHCHPEVESTMHEAISRGTTYGAPCVAEIELAEEVIASYPGLEQVRCVSSGTEATMSAIRLARGATGRDVIVKFSGCYHGHADHLLVAAGSGLATAGLPTSAGVPREFAALTRVLPLDDEEKLTELFAREGDRIAAVIIEPVPANNGLLLQRPAFLATLRSLTERHGALLIFDEVISGFRVARGGAAEYYGITPDLATFGKIIGGGLPAGAFAGPRRLMAHLAPDGPVYQAGTLSGNPLAMAAGVATLRLLTRLDAWAKLEQLGASLERQIAPVLSRSSVPVALNRMGSLLWFSFQEGAVPRSAEAVEAAAAQRFSPVFHGLLDRGQYVAPSAYEV